MIPCDSARTKIPCVKYVKLFFCEVFVFIIFLDFVFSFVFIEFFGFINFFGFCIFFCFLIFMIFGNLVLLINS